MAGYYVLSKGKTGKYSFNLKSGNHQTVLSSQAYASREAAMTGIASVQANGADDARFERKVAKDGQAYFVLKAGNGQVVGKSEMYPSAAVMEKGIASVKANGPSKTVKEPA
jgi:hypothetical protein